MRTLTLYPAIDLKDGRCVRLTQGRFEAETVYGDDPLAMANRWIGEGAEWLHLVNLNGAKGHTTANREAILSIVKSTKAHCQLGGGIRTISAMEAWLDIGVERIVLGTLVLENPKLVEEAAGRFPGRLAASLDSVGEALKVRGWVKDGGQHLLTAAAGLKNLGVSLVVHTDVERDGTSSGPNLSLAGAVASVSGLPTLVAGGVSGPKDLLAIKRLKADSLIVGAISGRALYEGTLSLKEGLSIFGSK